MLDDLGYTKINFFYNKKNDQKKNLFNDNFCVFDIVNFTVG